MNSTYDSEALKKEHWTKFHGLLFTLAVVFFFLMSLFCQAQEEEGMGGFTVEPVTIITLDDQGQKFRYPSSVFFDPLMQETYILNNGRGRIVVFGPEFFPLVSLGAGRGIDGPSGMNVDSTGRLYVCQRKTVDNSARITILNAAFFKEKEFLIEGFEGAEEFAPKRIAKGLDGTIYVAGGQPGVIVLDKDGNYLRHLYPLDRVSRRSEEKKTEEDASDTETENSAESGDLASTQPDAEQLGLPAEFLPGKTGPEDEEESPYSMGPVYIEDIVIDQTGNLYILSRETSKTYVYTPAEKFLFSFGQKGGSEGKLSQPRGIALDENKRVVYIVDYMRHTILAFNMADGKYLFEFGGKGWTPGWLQYPSDIAVDHKGRVIVADTFNQRVQVLEVRFNVEAPKPQEYLPSSRAPSKDPSGKK